MKNSICLTVLAMLGMLSAAIERGDAAVTIEVTSELLRYDAIPGSPETWEAAPVSSLFLVVADLDDNGFGTTVTPGTLSEGGFLNENDLILHLGYLQGPGIIFDSFSFSLGGDLTSGTSLALFWFPTLNSSNLSAEVGDYYGRFIDGASLAVPWEIPNDGQTVSLGFYTTEAFDPPPDAQPADAGNADRQVQAVPEPSTCILLAISGMALFGFGRRRFR